MRATAFLLALAACSGGKKGETTPSTPEQATAAADTLASLKAGDFAATQAKAAVVLERDAANSRAAVARALATYIVAANHLLLEGRAVIESADSIGKFDHPRMRSALEKTLAAYDDIHRDLSAAAGDTAFELELCIACWEFDWNGSGEIGMEDIRLLEVSRDASGNELPDGDPRRRPTFRFDAGDVKWALAMISFQSAMIEAVLAYRWNELDKLVMAFGGGAPEFRFELEFPERIKRARAHVLSGLDASRSAREAYLAETDDDREWVPSPTQASHPMPLPVNAALYATWAGVLDDAKGLVSSETGLSVTEIFGLADPEMPSPGGYIDIGRMLSAPKTIAVNVEALAAHLDRGNSGAPTAAQLEGFIGELFGDYYVKEMKPTPLLSRLSRMKGELEAQQDTFEEKLLYLLWLN